MEKKEAPLLKPKDKRKKEKIFICDWNGCEKKFPGKFSLKRHMFTHSKRKKHKCKHCEKRFALPQYLKEHEFTHTGENPFVCDFKGCDMSFKQRGKLSTHR